MGKAGIWCTKTLSTTVNPLRMNCFYENALCVNVKMKSNLSVYTRIPLYAEHNDTNILVN